MKHLLVTGGAGFIGANFVHYWLRQHPDDRRRGARRADLCGQSRQSRSGVEADPSFRFVHGDICDADLVARAATR